MNENNRNISITRGIILLLQQPTALVVLLRTNEKLFLASQLFLCAIV